MQQKGKPNGGDSCPTIMDRAGASRVAGQTPAASWPGIKPETRVKYHPVLWFLFLPPGSGCVGAKICVVWDKAQHGKTRSKKVLLLISEP